MFRLLAIGLKTVEGLVSQSGIKLFDFYIIYGEGSIFAELFCDRYDSILIIFSEKMLSIMFVVIDIVQLFCHKLLIDDQNIVFMIA